MPELASGESTQPIASPQISDFVHKLTIPLIAGKGDRLPVSLFPADGTWPTGTARYEKRNLALQIPVLESDPVSYTHLDVYKRQ